MQSFMLSHRHAFKRHAIAAAGRLLSLCRLHVAIVVCALTLAAQPVQQAKAMEVDLELVFAVDASGSVDNGEFRLQLEGIANAMLDAEVLRAIEGGKRGRIAVNLLVWGEAMHPKDESGWFVISTPQQAIDFASLVSKFPRRRFGGTGLGDGIARSITSMLENGFTAPRMVVDVSGDGRETPPREHTVMLPQARAMAAFHGVTLNGLAILNDKPDLDSYYRREMIVGDGAFVEVARDYRDFAIAMRRKLLREIQHNPVVSLK